MHEFNIITIHSAEKSKRLADTASVMNTRGGLVGALGADVITTMQQRPTEASSLSLSSNAIPASHVHVFLSVRVCATAFVCALHG
jgi:hypothetical protein